MPTIYDPIQRRGGGYNPGQLPISAFRGNAGMADGLAQGIVGASSAIADAFRDTARMQLEDRLVDKRGGWEERLSKQRLDAEERMSDKRLAYDRDRDKQQFGTNLLLAAFTGSNKLAEIMAMREQGDTDEARAFSRTLLGKVFDAMDQNDQQVAVEGQRGRAALSEAGKTGWRDAKAAYDSIMADLGSPRQAMDWGRSNGGYISQSLRAPLSRVANPLSELTHTDELEKRLDGRLREAFAKIDATNINESAKSGLKSQIVQELRGSFSSGEMLTETATDTSGTPGWYDRSWAEHFIGALDRSVDRYAQQNKGWSPWQPFKLTDAIAQESLKSLNVSTLTDDQRKMLEASLDTKQQQIQERIRKADPALADRLYPQNPTQSRSPALEQMSASNDALFAMAAKMLGMEPGQLQFGRTAAPEAPRANPAQEGGRPRIDPSLLDPAAIVGPGAVAPAPAPAFSGAPLPVELMNALQPPTFDNETDWSEFLVGLRGATP